MKYIECSLCHLDAPEDNSQDGVCELCLDAIQHDHRFDTEYERIRKEVVDDYR